MGFQSDRHKGQPETYEIQRGNTKLFGNLILYTVRNKSSPRWFNSAEFPVTFVLEN